MGWKDAPLADDTPAWQSAPIEQADRTMPERLERATGLTARVGLEAIPETVGGLAGLADTVMKFSPVGKVINAGMNYINPNYDQNKQAAINAVSNSGNMASNAIGLPTPETKAERIISSGGKLAAGTAAMAGAAGAVQKMASSPSAIKILNFLSSSPTQQVTSAAGAGAAGQYAKEEGAGFGGQLAASVAGGLTAGGLASLASTVGNGIKSIVSPNNLRNDALDALSNAKVEIGQLSPQVQKAITDDVEKALQTGNQLSPDAVRRLADYHTTGLTPMASSLNLNPAQVTQERNLAKMSANSSDPAAQKLANLQRDNDIKLIGGLNTIGAQTDDAVSAGNKLIGALNVKDEATKKVINNFYSQARATNGRSAALDPHDFTNQANNALDEALLGGVLPSDVRNKLNSIAQGKTPLTVDVAEQLKTNIATLQRNSNEPNVRLALGKVREALDNTNLLEGQGQEAINAFNKARSAHRAYMQIVEKTPALKAVRDGVEPDKFVRDYIVGNGSKSNIADVQSLKEALKDNNEAVGTIRGQIAAFLKNKATSGNADEVANFSPKSYNDALKNIGDEKLGMFFSSEDVKMLKAIGRVSSYEKFQPTGSAINNSNTSSALLTAVLDKVANSPLVRKIPLGGALVANPAKDVSNAIGARKALDTAKGLTVKSAKKPANLPISALLGLGAATENNTN